MLLTFLLLCLSSYRLAAQDNINEAYTSTEEGGCCFQFSYHYQIPQGVSSIETQLLAADITFSAVNYPLNSGWQQEVLQNQKRLRWSWPNGEIPLGEQNIFDFCLEGWNTADSIPLLVTWRAGVEVVQRDTLWLNCNSCWQANDVVIECQEDSTYSYLFTFTNESPFTVDRLWIREPEGQDLIAEEELILSSSLPPGSSQTNLEIHISAAAAAQGNICFGITPKRTLTDDIAVECCTATYCFALPICDHCCTDYDEFASAVNQGFSVDIDCTNEHLRLQAIALNECDRTVFSIMGLGAGMVDGNEAIIFGGLTEDAWYEICMTVTRQDRSGENCYEEASLRVCETFYYDCDDCILPENINWEDSCPSFVNLVCGCDDMTYLNACAALSWSGVQEWSSGPCGEPPVDTILLVAELNDDLQVALQWSTQGTTDYRYFLVQRRVQNGPWLTLAQVDDQTFDYLDTTPLLPNIVYRIVGVTWPGKVVFSNLGIIGLVGTDTPNQLSGGVWPNPTTDFLEIELNIAQQVPLQLWNTQGQLLFEFTTNSRGRYQLNVSTLPAGCYWLVGRIGENVWRKKVIVINS